MVAWMSVLELTKVVTFKRQAVMLFIPFITITSHMRNPTEQESMFLS